ncbi:bifunctional [glutamate--ammonia ligase]-adenylyl-L-tyrosine phosphorylase/[glutamate--ammonia-ligase] adenylyltransferase [Candidatus Macondimonas diazotrophica]|jgi:glutamate-ammonia-ligase adenylyltransferase|nr:bifunctional [glutamate--ammonia ligase]-adenylyl-L-tyrosine phosphorylase/[glutamate--ammonia-ligase] adenylyltransferase [Candidatus Macondimonas diazotrophica]
MPPQAHSTDLDAMIAALPEILQTEQRATIERFNALDGPQPPDWSGLLRLWACSSFAVDLCLRHPDWVRDLSPASPLPAGESLRHELDQTLASCTDLSQAMTALRRFRQRRTLQLAYRDINDLDEIEVVLTGLSDVADTCIGGAVAWLDRRFRAQWGEPLDRSGQPQELMVLAMGKLGGRELNFSSDIDLILVYPEAGTVAGPKPMEIGDYFTRLAQQLVKLLAEPSADGFAYRVDTRLRPFGQSGPLVLSAGAMELYYQQHGREWERYALIKARPLTGRPADVAALMATLRPFVYRRYLDFGAFEALRGMKSLIETEVNRKGLADNIKLGSGGIREVEFIVQAFQLVRGGQEAALREPHLLSVLPRLEQRGILASHTVARLMDAYRLLRRVENRLQQVRDMQTHELPTDPLTQARIAYGMGVPGWTDLWHMLEQRRRWIAEEFAEVFAAPQSDDADTSALDRLWQGLLSEAEAQSALTEAGYANPDGAVASIAGLRHSAMARTLSDTGQNRLARLMPLLVGAVGQGTHPDITLPRILRLIEVIARRSIYLALLIDHPTALSQLVRLCAASPWLAEYLARHPMLLDELLDARSLYAPPDALVVAGEVSRRIADTDDLERRMDVLRQVQQVNLLRIAAADLAGNLPLMRVSDKLTELAEVMLRQVLLLAWGEMVARYGRPRQADGRLVQFAVIAYGKLGGIELGYGSDLDLVFLHDGSQAEGQTDGQRVIDNATFFARLTQRLVHWLTAPTSAGRLYEIDTRLRPSGRSGLLVSSITGFADYQRRHAWTWEHQALVRARVVAGPPSLAQQFSAIRAEVLGRSRPADALRAEICRMRARMREALDKTEPGHWDLKHSAGGIADIEFMVQYLVLRYAHDHPSLLRWTDNIRLLETLGTLDLLPDGAVTALSACYRSLRQRIHALSLQQVPAMVPETELAMERAQVRALWRSLLEETA